MATTVSFYEDKYNEYLEILKKDSDPVALPEVHAAIHIVDIYLNTPGSEHLKFATDLSYCLSLFIYDSVKLIPALQKRAELRDVFTRIVSDSIGLHLKEEKNTSADVKRLADEFTKQSVDPSEATRKSFIAAIVGSDIKNLQLAEHKSPFASLCYVITSKLNLSLKEDSQTKLMKSANFSNGFLRDNSGNTGLAQAVAKLAVSPPEEKAKVQLK